MSRTIYRLLAASSALLIALTAADAVAQTDNTAAVPHAVCGTDLFNDGGEAQALENTRIQTPEVYRKMIAARKNRVFQNNRTLSTGLTRDFFLRDRITNKWITVTAELVYNGTRAAIWSDLADTLKSGTNKGKRIITQATIDDLATALETKTDASSRNPNQGILQNDEDVFGKPLDAHGQEGAIWFLMTDIKDGLTDGGGAYVAGFFSPFDQTVQNGSNDLNMLYIDSNEGLGTQSPAKLKEIKNTLAHEYQHLIHYYTNPSSETVYNEGCSETAAILNGYGNRLINNYLANTNLNLFRWSYNDSYPLLVDYSRAMTFMYYMYEHFGENFLTNFNKTRTAGMKRIDDAFAAAGINAHWQDALKGFAVANYVHAGIDHIPYIYKIPSNLPGLITPPATAGTFTAPFPATGSALIEPFATSYAVYNKPGGMKVKFEEASTPYSVVMMAYRGTKPVQAYELTLGQEYAIADGSKGYDKVAFALVNTTEMAQGVTANWTASAVTLGVDDAAAASGGLAVTSIVPTPSSGYTSMTFSSTGTAPVTLQLFDERGTLVRTLLDGARYDAGAHQVSFTTDGMADGLYLVRLVQGSKLASHTLVVMK